MIPGDGHAQPSPSWGQNNEQSTMVTTHQLVQSNYPQSQMCMPGQSTVQVPSSVPFQFHGHEQHQGLQQPIESWQETKPDALPVSVSSTDEQIAFNSYTGPSAGDLRGTLPTHSNPEHQQESMSSSLSHPNYTQTNTLRQQRLHSNPYTVLQVGHNLSHHGSLSSSTESPLGTSISGPSDPALNYVPAVQGYHHPQQSAFPRQPLSQHGGFQQQVQQNTVPEQSRQYNQSQLPQGAPFPHPQQQSRGQQQFLSPNQFLTQQGYQSIQQPHHMAPKFSPQQMSQLVQPPGFSAPLQQQQQNLHPYHHQQQLHMQPQFISEHGTSASFVAPLPPQALRVHDQGETPRSQSTPGQPVTVGPLRTESFPTAVHPNSEYPYPDHTSTSTVGTTVPPSSVPPTSSSSFSGFTPSVVGAPQPLSGNYFPHGLPPHIIFTSPPAPDPRIPSPSPSPKSKKQKLDDALPTVEITNESKKQSVCGKTDSNANMTENNRENYKKSTGSKGRCLRCFICGRSISRDLSRHMRIHEDVSRFRCVYPRGYCSHKTGYFNRQYDFKKHLLHYHFIFQDSSAKKYNSLKQKLPFEGTCDCGAKMPASTWLTSHIMGEDSEGRFLCPDLRQKWDDFNRRNNTAFYSATDIENVDPQTEQEQPREGGGNFHSASTNRVSKHTAQKTPRRDHH